MELEAGEKILDIVELQTHFFSEEGVARSVDCVSFDLKVGEVLGIVGESGCGKSVTAQSIMRLVPSPPGRIVGGKILFCGIDLVSLSSEQMRHIRGNRIAMIFQEPMTSLNPVYTVGNQISEMFVRHKGLNRKQAREASIDMLSQVQMPSPRKRVQEYPHQLSGGMRQRAMIAMALACHPEILIADEPTTALDVTVQAQILDLMMKLKEDYGTAIQMITHDLGVIAETADRVVVMYAGKVVEQADKMELFQNALHPYAKGLLKSIPVLGNRTAGEREKLHEIKGMVPSLYKLPEGCRFRNRCESKMDICEKSEPDLMPVADGHKVRCWLYSQEKQE